MACADSLEHALEHDSSFRRAWPCCQQHQGQEKGCCEVLKGHAVVDMVWLNRTSLQVAKTCGRFFHLELDMRHTMQTEGEPGRAYLQWVAHPEAQQARRDAHTRARLHRRLVGGHPA